MTTPHANSSSSVACARGHGPADRCRHPSRSNSGVMVLLSASSKSLRARHVSSISITRGTPSAKGQSAAASPARCLIAISAEKRPGVVSGGGAAKRATLARGALSRAQGDGPRSSLSTSIEGTKAIARSCTRRFLCVGLQQFRADSSSTPLRTTAQPVRSSVDRSGPLGGLVLPHGSLR